MAEFRSLEGLPKPPRSEGHPPDAESRFGRVLVDKWHAEAVERDASFRDIDKHGIEGVRFYHSHAAQCARAVAYAVLGVPESDPVGPSGHFIMHLGSMMHEVWQEAMQERYPSAKIEVTVVDDGGEMGGHADIELFDSMQNKDRRISIELKSQGGVAYKIAVGDRNAAAGPKLEHETQGALNARASGADEMVIIYLTRDAIGIDVAKAKGLDEMTRVTAEWTYTREEYEAIADEEIARVKGILKILDEDKVLPARKIPQMTRKHRPHNAVVASPKTGHVTVYDIDKDGTEQLVDGDKAWNCAYCRWQTTCARTGAHREPVAVLVQLGVLNEEAGNGEGEARE